MENLQKRKNKSQSADKLQEDILRTRHWRKTSMLAATMVGFAVVVVVCTPFLAATEFQFKLFGFSLAYFFIAQGVVVLIIAAVFMFSLSQDNIDREMNIGDHF